LVRERQESGQTKDRTPETLDLAFESVPSADFDVLLMEGVGVQVPPGYTAGRLVRERLGLATEALQARVGTLCLNGSPVDDLETCALGDGVRIAVSGALPGLAGACLRRGSVLAAMRAPITLAATGPGRGGTVTVRLFNVMLRLAGPPLLAQGVLLDRERLAEFLAGRSRRFWLSARSAHLDGRALDTPLEQSVQASLPSGRLRLRIAASGEGGGQETLCASS